MSAAAARYRKVAGQFTEKVARVPADRWSSPSPCEGWTARDVVKHCIDSSGLFLGFIGREVPAGPADDDDPLGAWTNARDAVQAALDDPAVATTEYDGFAGKATFEEGVDRFLSTDLVVHGWDLARAAGLDDTMDAEEVARARAAMGSMPEPMLRSPGAFGPAVEAPACADPQTELLAYLGRKA
jgi:uncharacterized protein (TIGR03086 family)